MAVLGRKVLCLNILEQLLRKAGNDKYSVNERPFISVETEKSSKSTESIKQVRKFVSRKSSFLCNNIVFFGNCWRKLI